MIKKREGDTGRDEYYCPKMLVKTLQFGVAFHDWY